MYYLVLPVVSVCTAFICPLFLFWYANLRVKFFYRKVTFEKADYILVKGMDGNIQVCKLYSSDIDYLQIKDTFRYRFI